jgi:hypothetical protein
MNPWYAKAIELLIVAALGVCVLISVMRLAFAVQRRKRLRDRIILLLMSASLLTAALMYCASHPTYYRFNDRLILRLDIDSVVQRYGSYDRGEVIPGERGRIGYYIYTDNGPIMPDHLDHYYWISFDENGRVTAVTDSVLPGG